MSPRRTLVPALAALAAAAPLLAALPSPAAAEPAAAPAGRPVLQGRALLPSDAYQPGPVSGADVSPVNGVVPPFPGQPVPGFSAVLDAGGGEYWGMPDNGYGTKGNSEDFLLRLYRVRPDFPARDTGAVQVGDFLQLRDPDGRIPFPLVREDRLLTGGDFDLESVRRVADGTFWFGEEFGPFLLHTDATGKVLSAPVPLPGVRSKEDPTRLDQPVTLPSSRGFEAMALSADGRFLHPVLEGALLGDPEPRRRVVHEFDLATEQYTGRTWDYLVDAAFPGAVLGDMTALGDGRYVVIERDDAQGAEARLKRLYVVELGEPGTVVTKRLAVDLLDIADPKGVSTPARPGELGVGSTFSFPLQSVESVEVLGGGRLLVANDNNYPGSDGRWTARDRPDDTELIVLTVPGLRGRG